MIFVFLCFICSCFASTLYTLATDSLQSGAKYVLAKVDQQTAQLEFLGSANAAGDVLPDCLSIDSATKRAVYCSIDFSLGEECLAVLDLISGRLVQKQCFQRLVVDNVAWQQGSENIFFNAYNETTSTNNIYLWDLNAKSIRAVVSEKGNLIKVGINTFSNSLKLFFLAVQYDCASAGLCNRLLTIDVEKMTVASRVDVKPDIEILVFDDNKRKLYAWCADQQIAAELIELNWKTGAVGTPLMSSKVFSANGGASAIDQSTGTIVASLLNMQQSNRPYFFKSNLYAAHPSHSLIANPNMTFPWMLDLGFA